MKLKTIGIIKDTDLTANEMELSWKELKSGVANASFNNELDIFFEAFTTFMAKVYINMRWSNVYNDASLDLIDVSRFVNDKPKYILYEIYSENFAYNIAKIEEALSYIEIKVQKLVKYFHHDYLYAIEDTDSASVIDGGSFCNCYIKGDMTVEMKRKLYTMYNGIVVGTKLVMTENMTDGEYGRNDND